MRKSIRSQISTGLVKEFKDTAKRIKKGLVSKKPLGHQKNQPDQVSQVKTDNKKERFPGKQVLEVLQKKEPVKPIVEEKKRDETKTEAIKQMDEIEIAPGSHKDQPFSEPPNIDQVVKVEQPAQATQTIIEEIKPVDPPAQTFEQPKQEEQIQESVQKASDAIDYVVISNEDQLEEDTN